MIVFEAQSAAEIIFVWLITVGFKPNPKLHWRAQVLPVAFPKASKGGTAPGAEISLERFLWLGCSSGVGV